MPLVIQHTVYEIPRKHRRKPKSSAVIINLGRPMQALIVPAEVWAERDERLKHQHASLTGLICGDPLPGYSALDKGAK